MEVLWFSPCSSACRSGRDTAPWPPRDLARSRQRMTRGPREACPEYCGWEQWAISSRSRQDCVTLVSRAESEHSRSLRFALVTHFFNIYHLMLVNTCLNVKGHFQPGKGPSRDLLHACLWSKKSNIAKVRFQL